MSMLTQALGIDRAKNMRTDIDTSQLEQMYSTLSDPYANYDYYRRAMAESQPTVSSLLGAQAAAGGSSAIAQQQAQQYSAQGGENVLNRMGGDRLRREDTAANLANQLANFDLQEIQLEDQKRKMQQNAAMEPFKLATSFATGGIGALGAKALGGIAQGASGLLGNLGQVPGMISQGLGGLQNFGGGVLDAFQGGSSLLGNFGTGMKAIGSGIVSAGQGIGGLLGTAGQGLQTAGQAAIDRNTVANQNVVGSVAGGGIQQISPPQVQGAMPGGVVVPPQTYAAPPPPQPNNFTYSNYSIGGQAPSLMGLGLNMSSMNSAMPMSNAYSNAFSMQPNMRFGGMR